MDHPNFLEGVSSDSTLEAVKSSIDATLLPLGLKPDEVNLKPWGLEYKFSKQQTPNFVAHFFGADALPETVLKQPFGPKIIAVQGTMRLSWHFHERKDAYLVGLTGDVDVYANATDTEVTPVSVPAGQLIHIPHLIRHRLGSPTTWIVVA